VEMETEQVPPERTNRRQVGSPNRYVVSEDEDESESSEKPKPKTRKTQAPAQALPASFLPHFEQMAATFRPAEYRPGKELQDHLIATKEARGFAYGAFAGFAEKDENGAYKQGYLSLPNTMSPHFKNGKWSQKFEAKDDTTFWDPTEYLAGLQTYARLARESVKPQAAGATRPMDQLIDQSRHRLGDVVQLNNGQLARVRADTTGEDGTIELEKYPHGFELHNFASCNPSYMVSEKVQPEEIAKTLTHAKVRDKWTQAITTEERAAASEAVKNAVATAKKKKSHHGSFIDPEMFGVCPPAPNLHAAKSLVHGERSIMKKRRRDPDNL